MEGIDLAGVVDSDFQGILINFAPPRPAGFANFHGAGRGGARLAFLRGGAGQPFFRGAGRGGAHIPAVYVPSHPISFFLAHQTCKYSMYKKNKKMSELTSI